MKFRSFGMIFAFFTFFITVYSLKNEFISDCLYYDTPKYETDIITFVCDNKYRLNNFFDLSTTTIKC